MKDPVIEWRQQKAEDATVSSRSLVTKARQMTYEGGAKAGSMVTDAGAAAGESATFQPRARAQARVQLFRKHDWHAGGSRGKSSTPSLAPIGPRGNY